MDRRSVSGAEAAKWRLAAPHDKETQGLAVSGFAHLPNGSALMLRFDWLFDPNKPAAGRGAWLGLLKERAPITDSDGKDPRAAAVALSWAGLQRMGLDANSLASFDRPFREGMMQPDRLRRLGDRRGGQWQTNTVIDGGPVWSANTPEDPATRDRTPRAFGPAPDDDAPEPAPVTPQTVHALVLLYEADEARLAQWVDELTAALAAEQVSVTRQCALSLRFDKNGVAREHFGFADGLSQPIPFAAGVVQTDNGADLAADASLHCVPLGEILFGHANAHHELADGPAAPDDAAAQAAGLRPHPRGAGFRDLGRNGSYLVARELRQNVGAFWRAMDKSAREINATRHADAQIDADWVASRVVGRNRDGHVLRPEGPAKPAPNGGADNEFGFFDADRHGFGCPMGAHVRRGNPRDGLAPTAADKEVLRTAANSHRILRRGRKFGPDLADPTLDDGADRGLLFLCLNTDLGRQFEFVQQTWALNANFAFLYDETDPLIGPPGGFTIPEKPLRRIIEVESFVKLVGGDYFFLPSLPALHYLARL